MDTRPHQRVLPSNAPTYQYYGAQLTDDSLSAPSSLLCDDFNNGHECRVCDSLHICSECYKDGHGAAHCKLGIDLESATRFTSFHEPLGEVKASQYGSASSFLFPNPPNHTAQAAIKREQKKRTIYRGLENITNIDRRTLERYHFDPIEQRSPKYKAYRKKNQGNRSKDGKGSVWTGQCHISG